MKRRKFVSMSATALPIFLVVPRHVLGGRGFVAPSDKLNVAAIGAGGQARTDLGAMIDENVVALCDVDWDRAAASFEQFPKAVRYKDFRHMLEKQKDIDAVIVAIPDHVHAAATMMALNLGKHVYTEKPLTYTVYEARKLAEAAREAGVITQMGIQGHASESIRLLCEWIWDGAIGDVYEVHAFTPHPVWPQGIDRPIDTPPIPPTLNWDLWIGPAPYRPYHPCYHPAMWRGWWDFGTGGLGDMGCHILDHVVWSLKLGAPKSVEASHSEFVPEGLNWDKPKNTETYPRASLVTYHFPERENFPPLKLTWYDGGLMPAKPEELEEDRMMGDQFGGALYIGTKGKILCGSHGANGVRIIPESKMQAYKKPNPSIPRSMGHRKEWIASCKSGKPAGANFDFSGPLTETVLLGNIALRLRKKLYWDSDNFTFTNAPEANEFLHRSYREGWTL